MQEKINNLIEKYEAVRTAAVYARTFYRVALVIVPAAVSAYLIVKYTDRIVMGLGVALGLYAFGRLVAVAYVAESSKVKKARK